MIDILRSQAIRACTVLAAVVALSLGARPAAGADWKADWEKAVAEADGQSLKIIVQANGSEGYQAVVNEFKKRFPKINVQSSLMNPSDAGPRILTEQRNGLYAWDVWWGTASNMNNVALPANALEKIDGYFILPEVSDVSNWRNPKYLYTSEKGHYVFVHTHFVMDLGVYNTKLVPGGRFTMDSLVDPKLKGKIYIRQPSRPHGGSMMLAQVAHERGMDFVRRIFTDMAPVYVDNDRQNFMTAVKGQSAVTFGISENALEECRKNGGCKNLEPTKIGFLHSRGVSILKNPPDKAAAKVFVNWLLSKEGQEVYVREWAKFNPAGAFSMRKDVAGNPAHANSVPDFDHLDKYAAVSLDSGDAELKGVVKLFNELRAK